jgi:hypothetical protein
MINATVHGTRLRELINQPRPSKPRLKKPLRRAERVSVKVAVDVDGLRPGDVDRLRRDFVHRLRRGAACAGFRAPPAAGSSNHP